MGWKGFVDGKDSGVYRASPLAVCNAADGMATPLAQAEYERFYETLGGKPVHATLATHWARLVELLYAAERAHELATDPDIINPDVRNIPTGIVGEGVGVVEAPRGTLFHHYKTDDKGMVTAVNLIVGTTNNNAAISMSLKKAAEGLLTGGKEIKRRHAQHDRDGLPRLRSVLRLRHAHAARRDAARDHRPQRDDPRRRGDRQEEHVADDAPSSSAWGTRSSPTTGSA